MEKKILMLHSSSDLYGASLIFSNVIKTLQEAGYKPIVLLSDEGPLVDKIRFLGVQVILIDLAVLRRKSYQFTPNFFSTPIKTLKPKDFILSCLKNTIQ